MATPLDAASARDAAVLRLIAALAAGEYEEVLRMAPRSRVTAEQLRAEVMLYPATLAPFPAQANSLIDYVAIDRSSPPAWSVVVPLFSVEEGRSDLSLELTMVESEGASYEVQIDNLHVR